MKGIGNGRQNVHLLILDTWKNIPERNNEVGSNFAYLLGFLNYLCHFFFLVFVNANKVLRNFSSKPFCFVLV